MNALQLPCLFDQLLLVLLPFQPWAPGSPPPKVNQRYSLRSLVLPQSLSCSIICSESASSLFCRPPRTIQIGASASSREFWNSYYEGPPARTFSAKKKRSSLLFSFGNDLYPIQPAIMRGPRLRWVLNPPFQTGVFWGVCPTAMELRRSGRFRL